MINGRRPFLFPLLVSVVAAAWFHAPEVGAQTAASATLTRWDVFAATGGTNSASTNATRNPRVITLDPNDGSVWFLAQRPTLRLGRLDPVTNSYAEWAPVTGSETSGAPAALALASNGDVWLATGGDPELAVRLAGTNTFRKYGLPYAGAQVQGVAPTTDGSAVYVAMQAGANTSILRVPRGPEPPAGTTSVTAARWRFASSSDNPAHLTLDSAGFLWFTNRFRNTVARFDPSLSTNNLTQWVLPAGTAAAGLQIVDGPSGASTVCVVAEGTVTGASGQAACLDVASNTFSTFTRPTGFDFPQHVSVSSAGELFVTEQAGNAVSFIASTAVTSAALATVNPLGGSSNTRLAVTTAASVTVSETTVTPQTRTVLPSVEVIDGTESAAGHLRFPLPPLPALADQPGVDRESRPAGISGVVDVTGAGTGSIYVAEYFDGPAPIETRMAGAISRFTLGGASPDKFQVLPAELTFSADAGGIAPSGTLSVEERHGRTLSWTAAATQPWLSLSPTSGTTPQSITVSIDHSALTAAGSPYADTITIDDGPGGAAAESIPVTLTVVERPTMVVTPMLLYFKAVNTDATPPGAKTFAISSEGGGTLEWTATVNIPGVEALLEVPGQAVAPSISGAGPATVTLHIGSVPGTEGLREGAVTISSNAINASAVVEIDYEVTSVTQALLVDKAAVSFEVVLGGAAPASQIVNVTNAGGAPVTWGTIAPYTETAPLPAWLQVSPQVAAAAAGQTIPMTVSVNHASLEPGTHTALITIDDHTGNSPPATIGVALIVRAAAIEFSTDTVTFDATESGGEATKTVTLTNPGDAPLTFTPQVTINNGSGWLTVSPAGELTLAPGGSLPFTVTTSTAGLAAGTYTAQITVANPFSTNGSDTVFITLTVAATGIITIDPVSVAASAQAGANPPVQAVAIGNSGSAPFTYTASIVGSAPWLSISGGASATVAPATSMPLSLSINASGLSVGTHTATIQIAAATGATNSPQLVTVTFTVSDTIAPVFTAVPASQTLEATGPGGAAATFAAEASDTSGTPTVGYSQAPGSVFPLGTTTVTATATDAQGNAATATFTITVIDTTAPVISGTPADITAEATGASGAAVSYTVPSASDLVDGARTVICAPASGSTFALGTSSVTCSAADTRGNASSAALTVTVQDTTAPALVVPASRTVVGSGATAVTYPAATATDAVGPVTIAYSHPSGGTFLLGLTTVTVTATDAAGNASSGSFTVTVSLADTTPPVVTVPSTITAEATVSGGAVVNFVASASDAVSGTETATCTPASGSTFALGTTTVSCSATDDAGNTGSATFGVLVRDTIAPALAVPPAQSVSAAGPTAVSYPPATATDAVGPVTITYSTNSGAVFPLGTTTVTVTASDAAGNVTTGSFAVTVTQTDTTPPTFTQVPANQTIEAIGPAGAAASFAATATDASGTPAIVYSHAPGSVFPFGATLVTATATDAPGNNATATFTITVVDTTAPAMSGVPANIAVEATSAAGAVVGYILPSAVDLVDGSRTVTCAPASSSTFPLGTRPVTCTATDTRNNSATATFTVTVRDTTAPVVTPPPNQSVVGSGPTAVTYPAATATEAVSTPVTFTYSHASGSLFPVGTTTVTVTAADAAGNVSTPKTFTVTVAVPAYTLSSSALYFKTGRLAYCNGIAVGPNWKDQGLVVANTGSAPLAYSATTATSWIRISPASGSLSAGASATLTVSVDLSGLGRGIYHGSLAVTVNGTPTNVPVTLEIGNALPTLCLTPTTMTWGTVKTNTTLPKKSYNVTNVGDDPMPSWGSTQSITDGTLNLSASGGSAGMTVTITIKTGRRKGAQSGQVDISAPGAVNGNQTIDTSWTVR